MISLPGSYNTAASLIGRGFHQTKELTSRKKNTLFTIFLYELLISVWVKEPERLIAALLHTDSMAVTGLLRLCLEDMGRLHHTWDIATRLCVA